jgi:hypothetical protein
MTDATATLIATALNTAWNTGTYAKPVDGRGASGFTASFYENKANHIERLEMQRSGTYASLRQVFRIWLVHPTEAAIDYTIGLVNAMTLASTIVCNPAQVWYDSNGFNAIIDVVTIQ